MFLAVRDEFGSGPIHFLGIPQPFPLIAVHELDYIRPEARTKTRDRARRDNSFPWAASLEQ